MEVQLKVIGCLLILLAIIHLAFPKYFNWKKELSEVSLINRQMMYIHTLFIGVTIFLMGVLCLTSAKEILETKFGNKVALGLSIFWAIRLFLQFFGYSSVLWKGKKFKTAIHFAFVFLWTYFTMVFFITFNYSSK
jgi:hypothetical protein